MAIPAATATLMLRVDPNWAIETVSAAPVRASSLMPGPSWPNSSRQSRGSVVCSSRAAPGHDVDGDHRQACFGGKAQQFGGVVVVAQSLVAVGDHGAAAIPAATADDVDGVHGERVGGAHHPADIGVVAEVLDRHVQRRVSGCRCRRRSPHASSTGRRRRRCGCRRRAATPGRTAGRRAVDRPRGRLRLPERPIRWDRVRSSRWSRPRRGCPRSRRSHTAAPR